MNFKNLLIVLLLPLSSQAECTCVHRDWYAVKPNGAVPTRPAYTFTNGVLGKKVVDRVPIGYTCDIDKPTKKSGKDLWAQYDSTGLVTLCVKQ